MDGRSCASGSTHQPTLLQIKLGPGLVQLEKRPCEVPIRSLIIPLYPPREKIVGTQSLIVHIDSEVARRVRTFLGSPPHGYGSLSEFAEVALLNQLDLELHRPEGADGDDPSRSAGPKAIGAEQEFLSVPSDIPPALATPAPGGEALFVLTNRLGPLKVAARVLANLAKHGQWPSAKEFHQAAAMEARELGLRLREQDQRDGITGGRRRAIGFPVGRDKQAAMDRFIFSFTASIRDGRCVGPLAILGLANCMDESIALTESGWTLAVETSPLLDANDTETLSEREAAVLRDRIREAPEECEAVAEFLSFVKKAAGRQARVDELLATAHADWSADLTIAHRSAMLGRLADLRTLTVSGRGPEATITINHAAQEFDQPSIQEAS